MKLSIVLVAALTACSGVPRSVPAQAPSGRADDAQAQRTDRLRPYRWEGPASAIRVIPLRHDGTPEPCVEPGGERPCDLEYDGRRNVYYRARTAAPAAVLGPGLALRRPGQAQAALELAPGGELIGPGVFAPPSAVRVLACELLEGPELRCRHSVPDGARDRVWNVENCAASFAARVEGGAIVVRFEGSTAAAPTVAARVEPASVGERERTHHAEVDVLRGARSFEA